MKKAGATLIENIEHTVPKGGNKKYAGRSIHEDKIDLSPKVRRKRKKRTPKRGFTKFFRFDSMVIHAKSGDIKRSYVVSMDKVRQRYGDVGVTYQRDLDGELITVENNNFLPMQVTWLFIDGKWTMFGGVLNKNQIVQTGATEAFYENESHGVSSDVRFSINQSTGRVSEIWV